MVFDVKHLVSEEMVPHYVKSVGATWVTELTAHGGVPISSAQTGSECVPLLLTRDASVK